MKFILYCKALCSSAIVYKVVFSLQDMITKILELEVSKSKVESTLQAERLVYFAEQCVVLMRDHLVFYYFV